MKRKDPTTFLPTVEALETRCLMTVGFSAVLSKGTLTLTGTDEADRIVVRQESGFLKVQGHRFAAADVTRIVIDGGGGDDFIDLRQLRDKAACVVFGGHGNDTIYGTAHGDVLFGGEGFDRLFGRGGRDQLDGGNGADDLHGGLGSDDLRGGLGSDRLYGGAGADRLDGGTRLAGADQVFAHADLAISDGDSDFLHGGLGRDVAVNGRDLVDRLQSIELDRRDASVVAQANHVVDLVKADLAGRLKTPLESIRLFGQEDEVWSDSSLGHPEAGGVYAAVLTPGYRLIVGTTDHRFEYHTDLDDQFVFVGEVFHIAEQ